MSAQQTYSKPPINWPNLPPEIWTLIFRHATLVPDLISPDLCNYGKSHPTIRKQRKSYKQSLVTKRYLIRVCKAWYSGAIRFLYESILLGRGRVLASLCEALKRSHRISTETALEELPLGWWTKRIDVAMRDSTDDASHDLALVGDIVAMLPNLSILLFDITGHRYSLKLRNLDVFPSNILPSTSPENLNVMYYYSEHVVPQSQSWLDFLISRPHLRSISDVSARGFTKKNIQPLTIPSLTSLHLTYRWTIDYFSEWELPNLQHLTYHVTDLIHTFWSPEPFFRNHGAKLRSLTMDNFISLRLFDIISETCLNLISIELIIDDWTSLSTHIFALPPVNLIKLACRKPHSKRAVYLQLFNFIVQAKMMSPTLKTVRFIDEQNVSGLHAYSRLLQDQLKILSEAGVALEDSEGILLDPS